MECANGVVVHLRPCRFFRLCLRCRLDASFDVGSCVAGVCSCRRCRRRCQGMSWSCNRIHRRARWGIACPDCALMPPAASWPRRSRSSPHRRPRTTRSTREVTACLRQRHTERVLWELWGRKLLSSFSSSSLGEAISSTSLGNRVAGPVATAALDMRGPSLVASAGRSFARRLHRAFVCHRRRWCRRVGRRRQRA